MTEIKVNTEVAGQKSRKLENKTSRVFINNITYSTRTNNVTVQLADIGIMDRVLSKYSKALHLLKRDASRISSLAKKFETIDKKTASSFNENKGFL